MPRQRVPEHVLWQRVGDESVVLDLQSGQYFSLDEVGTFMFSLQVEGVEEAAALELLAERYDASTGRLRDDLRSFVRRLVELGLLASASESSDA